MATAYSFNDVSLFREREFFVDANVFISRFYHERGVIPSIRARAYMNTYDNLVADGYRLRTSFDVISEYINRAMRMSQRDSMFDEVAFKRFRNSPAGHDALRKIHQVLRDHILKQVLIVDRPFDNATVATFLVIDRLDFVDKSIVAICGSKSYILFSDDGDFRDSSVEILTNNPVYFSE